jgi:putative restriction endonuclease
VFGEIPGYPVGSPFVDRVDLARSGVHPPRMKGISGSQSEGADSIVVSGGYEEAAATRTPASRSPTKSSGAATVPSPSAATRGCRVRVMRGAGGDPAHSPAMGLRYDGLFHVERYWHEIGIAGFRVYRYELVAETSTTPSGSTVVPLPTGVVVLAKVTSTVQRIVRSTPVAQAVKELHGHCCQACGYIVMVPTGPYAEGAHIRPLGGVHAGPDAADNMLCLCANCHVRFDRGAIHISPTGQIIETATSTFLVLCTRAHVRLPHVPNPTSLVSSAGRSCSRASSRSRR